MIPRDSVVAKVWAGRINQSTLYRLQRKRGRVDLFSATMLEASCDVVQCGPGELLERDSKRRGGG